ncbi:hypothetical protein CFU_2236 [Collimonas fungivorans Ter331]|uniref:Uncharacterized protein n=1 Tax=Collimonas fungivorans (strain Ter331) TaxID=1005048 RepID=G0AKD6_COLFT|nr:hypothetical protein CFU_2236 [Collimonas fungivorans Ter331]
MSGQTGGARQFPSAASLRLLRQMLVADAMPPAVQMHVVQQVLGRGRHAAQQDFLRGQAEYRQADRRRQRHYRVPGPFRYEQGVALLYPCIQPFGLLQVAQLFRVLIETCNVDRTQGGAPVVFFRRPHERLFRRLEHDKFLDPARLAKPVVGHVAVQSRMRIGRPHEHRFPGPAPARPQAADVEIAAQLREIFQDAPLRQVILVRRKRLHVRPVKMELLAWLQLQASPVRQQARLVADRLSRQRGKLAQVRRYRQQRPFLGFALLHQPILEFPGRFRTVFIAQLRHLFKRPVFLRRPVAQRALHQQGSGPFPEAALLRQLQRVDFIHQRECRT